MDDHAVVVHAHNKVVMHYASNRISLRGRYYLIRVLHHLHGFHNKSKLIDFYYALTARGRDTT